MCAPALQVAVISGVLGGEAGGERDRQAALELAERLLERLARRVGRARVVEVLDVLAGARLGVGGGLVDRRNHRAVRSDPGVRPAWTARVPKPRCVAVRCRSGRERLEQIRTGDDPLGLAVASDQQRLLITDQQLDRRARRIIDRHGREGRLHHLLTSRRATRGRWRRAAAARARRRRRPRSPPLSLAITGSWESPCCWSNATASRTG